MEVNNLKTGNAVNVKFSGLTVSLEVIIYFGYVIWCDYTFKLKNNNVFDNFSML